MSEKVLIVKMCNQCGFSANAEIMQNHLCSNIGNPLSDNEIEQHKRCSWGHYDVSRLFDTIDAFRLRNTNKDNLIKRQNEIIEKQEEYISKAEKILFTNPKLGNEHPKEKTDEEIREVLAKINSDYPNAHAHFQKDGKDFYVKILVDLAETQTALEAERVKVRELNKNKRMTICIWCGVAISIDPKDIQSAYQLMREHDLECKANPLQTENTAFRVILKKYQWRWGNAEYQCISCGVFTPIIEDGECKPNCEITNMLKIENKTN